MDSSLSISNRVFVNADADKAKVKDLVPMRSNDSSTPQPATVPRRVDPIVNYGSAEVIADAQSMFNRANSYAELSSNIKEGLQTYESVQMTPKREALKQLMGVDIYA